MSGRKSTGQSLNRPYRSKRHRPCDVCRRRKHACHLEDQAPCRICRELGVDCTFNEPPTKRRRPPRLPTSASTPEGERDPDSGHYDQNSLAGSEIEASVPNDWAPGQEVAEDCPDYTIEIGHLGNLDDSVSAEMFQTSHHDVWYATSGLTEPGLGSLSAAFAEGMGGVDFAPDDLFPLINQFSIPEAQQDFPSLRLPEQGSNRATQRSNTPVPSQPQASRALDSHDETLSAQLFGPSGEMDPYLLRHVNFSEDGSCNFGRFQYRSLFQTPTGELNQPNSAFPAHFLISAPKQSSNVPTGSSIGDTDQRKELNRIVDPELGVRYIGLTETLVPKANILEGVPPYLLAAIYAVAESFRRYDPILNVSQTDVECHKTLLWEMAHWGILGHMHAPSLALVQALLIYLQRPMGEAMTASADSRGHWSLLGSAINVANQLGLHLDCQLWPIPDWEKRLRRRLWWMIHTEATWRSLLLGLPLPIHRDQWDVAPLDEADFVIDHFSCPNEETAAQALALQKPCAFCHGGHDFRFLAELSLIAYDLYTDFFTLRATNALSVDFETSLKYGKRYLARLDDWHANLPKQMAVYSVSAPQHRDYFHPGSAAHIKLAFLTLKALTYRAILRPIANLSSQGISSTGISRRSDTSPQASMIGVGNPTTPTIANATWGIFQDALTTAQQASQFAQSLGSYDRNSFSRSWSRACYATISNFIMLLLVLAPTAVSAKQVLAALSRWVITLREQSVMFETMQLGLLRLDAMFRLGLEKALRLTTHVKESVRKEKPTPSYKN
ncbi:unnamed protein product [Clonostachys chloroleuca]|uniref:Zn(2)-C6 fungal-type domain-containing protein n=1 Tax=Clonostachys chloroleuca TaxID=1926264 RepID=A0AA35MDD7_9HYPO|nr:unnamed protein product [Clonostachys chloroleuca]